ncbi:MAG: hypothetical protein ACKVOO_10880 [Burkholderiaceae bacterium]
MSSLQYLYPTSYAIASTAAYLWLLWIGYVVSMGFYRAKKQGRLTRLALVLSSPAWFTALVFDFVGQLTLFALIFWERPRILSGPREWLITKRLQRYISDGAGWRYRLAHWLCTHLLDPFDPTGSHCTPDIKGEPSA